MNLRKSLCLIALGSGFALWGSAPSIAQQQTTSTQPELTKIALKSGESLEIGTVYFVSQCKSIMTAAPEIEMLEGPPELSLTIKAGDVVPRNQGCTRKVSGGTIIVTAKEIKETKIARLMYRIKYKTKDGDRQRANAYMVGLLP